MSSACTANVGFWTAFGRSFTIQIVISSNVWTMIIHLLGGCNVLTFDAETSHQCFLEDALG